MITSEIVEHNKMKKSFLVLLSTSVLFLSILISPASADILPPKNQFWNL